MKLAKVTKVHKSAQHPNHVQLNAIAPVYKRNQHKLTEDSSFETIQTLSIADILHPLFLFL